MSTITTKDIIAFIWKVIRPFPISITILFLWATVWAIDISLAPYILKIIINRVNESPSTDVFDNLFAPAVFYVLLSFFVVTFSRVYSYFVEIILFPKMRHRIATTIFTSLMDQSHHFYQLHFTGSLVDKVNDLIRSTPDVIEIVIDRLFCHGFALVCAIFTLRLVHMKYALALFIWAMFFLFGSLFCSQKIVFLSGKWSAKVTLFTGRMVDVLSNILSVRLFARKDNEREAIISTYQEVVER